MADVAELDPQFPSRDVAPVLMDDMADVLDAVEVVEDAEDIEAGEVGVVSVLSPQVPNPVSLSRMCNQHLPSEQILGTLNEPSCPAVT